MSKETYTCQCCGKQRGFYELNGLLLINGQWDDRQAYCIRVAECQSNEASEIIDWMIEQYAESCASGDHA